MSTPGESLAAEIRFKNIEALFPFGYAIPSIVIYIRILILLIVNRKKTEFSNSFFRILILCGISVSLIQSQGTAYKKSEKGPKF